MITGECEIKEAVAVERWKSCLKISIENRMFKGQCSWNRRYKTLQMCNDGYRLAMPRDGQSQYILYINRYILMASEWRRFVILVGPCPESVYELLLGPRCWPEGSII